MPDCFAERGERRFVSLEGIDGGRSGERECERAKAREQIGDALGAPDTVAHQLGHHGLRIGRGLEESAGRQLHLRRPEADGGRGARHQAFAVDGEACDAEPRCLACQLGQGSLFGPHAVHDDVEAGLGLGDAHPRLALAAEQRPERRLELWQARRRCRATGWGRRRCRSGRGSGRGDSRGQPCRRRGRGRRWRDGDCRERPAAPARLRRRGPRDRRAWTTRSRFQAR